MQVVSRKQKQRFIFAHLHTCIQSPHLYNCILGTFKYCFFPLKIVDKMYVPDEQLSSVIGKEAFKMKDIFSRLRLNKHLDRS